MAQVLIIDDDPAVRGVLRTMLTREGHSVREEAGAEAALALLAKERPDVIISDMYMPEMDGIEFLIWLEGIAPEVPVIAISGGGHAGKTHVLDDARELGAAGTLSKPFTYEELHQLMAKVLA